ncbi:MAG: MFS transporter [Bacillota bacterium]
MKRLERTGTMAVACTIFLALGLVTASIGPAVPDLAARSESSLAALGGLFTALFLGALLTILAAGRLTDRFGEVPLLLFGVLLTGAGILGLTLVTSLPAMLAMGLVAGLGHGALDIAVNVLVARLFADRSVAALNLLNVFFGVGAMLGPAAASLSLRLWQTGLSGLWLGAGLMLLTSLLIPLLPRRVETGPEERAQAAAGASPLRSPLVWAFGLMLMLYVGVESGLGGWATTYLSATTPLDTAMGALVTSGFWMALTVGRLLGAGLGSRITPERLLQAALTGSLAGGLLLVASTGNAWFSVLAILLLGLSFGPVFPAVGITTTAFPHAPGAASSLVIASGIAGGMLLPWLQGVLMESGGPRLGISLVLAGALGMLLLQRLAPARPRTSV